MNPCDVQFFQDEFNQGFRLEFEGIREAHTSPNLKSAMEHPDIVWEKLSKELALNRIAGPFDKLPFQNFVCFPIGIVPKKVPGKFWHIHHLSYPSGSSVNDGIPKKLASVKYQTVDDAITMIVSLGLRCFLAKTHIADVFRICPMHPDDYELLGFSWEGKYYYDKCLPIDALISC